MPKNILVTGGAGFIGSHLVDRLLAQGHRVVIVDDMRSNVVEPDDFKSVTDNQLYFLKMSVEDIFNSPWLLSHCGSFDEIYHLASPVGPVGVLRHAGQIVRQVVDSTYIVAKLALFYKAKLVDVSTSEVYGGGQQGLCAEDMPRIIQAETTVRLEYAVAKLAMETALINMTKVSPLQAVIVRPFNVAGPRQGEKGGFVIPRFVGQALRRERLTVYGDGQQVRAFTHVEDIVDGLLLAMDKGVSGEVYNLGNPENKVTINTVADWVQIMVGRVGVTHVDPKIIHGPLFAEAADKYPDHRKAFEELGWIPKYGFTQIVRDVRDYMQSALQTATETVKN